MPTPKPIPTPFYLLPFLAIILIGVITTVRNHRSWQEKTERFKATTIHSRILGLNALNRGNYAIHLQLADTLATFDLPIAFEVNRDGIRVGDSLSKANNSCQCVIYRITQNAPPRKISELMIY